MTGQIPNQAHDHEHDDHAPIDDGDGPVTPSQVLEQAVRELLIEKGVITAEEVHAQIDATDSRNPMLGAKVVAKAWNDPDFKGRLLADPRGTLKADFDLEVGNLAELVVIENTPDTHNVVVCTLCSCYPRMLLGIPPAWYKSSAYRSRVVHEPRDVLKEFGTELPGDTAVRVFDSTADMRYLILPIRPEGTEGWSEKALAELITRDCMIGVALPKSPPPGS